MCSFGGAAVSTVKEKRVRLTFYRDVFRVHIILRLHDSCMCLLSWCCMWPAYADHAHTAGFVGSQLAAAYVGRGWSLVGYAGPDYVPRGLLGLYLARLVPHVLSRVCSANCIVKPHVPDLCCVGRPGWRLALLVLLIAIAADCRCTWSASWSNVGALGTPTFTIYSLVLHPDCRYWTVHV